MTKKTPKRPASEDSKATRDQVQMTKGLEKLMEGKSVTQAAKEMGVDRKALSRLLTRDEAKQIVLSGLDRLRRMASESMDVLERTLRSDNEKLAQSTAVTILKAVGVIKPEVEDVASGKRMIVNLGEGNKVIFTHANPDGSPNLPERKDP